MPDCKKSLDELIESAMVRAGEQEVPPSSTSDPVRDKEIPR